MNRNPILTPTAFTCMLLCLTCFDRLQAQSISRTFYVDAQTGNDQNSGRSENSAWKSLSKITNWSGNFQPGDSILFKAGQVWEGQLEVFEIRGTPTNPIVISAYGEGPKPHTKGNGEKDWTVKLQNCHYTIFDGFEITNLGPSPDGWRYGIEIRANNKGEVFGTQVRNCEVHDVNGEMEKAKQQGGGILIKNTGTVRSRLVGTIIEGNHIHDVVRNGI